MISLVLTVHHLAWRGRNRPMANGRQIKNLLKGEAGKTDSSSRLILIYTEGNYSIWDLQNLSCFSCSLWGLAITYQDESNLTVTVYV